MTRVTRLLRYWTQREALTPPNKTDMFVKRCLAGSSAGPVPPGAGAGARGRGFGPALFTAIKNSKNEKRQPCPRRRDADPAVPVSCRGRDASLVFDTVVTLPVQNESFVHRCVSGARGTGGRERAAPFTVNVRPRAFLCGHQGVILGHRPGDNHGHVRPVLGTMAVATAHHVPDTGTRRRGQPRGPDISLVRKMRRTLLGGGAEGHVRPSC